MIIKTKLHGGKVTDFYNMEIPTRDSNHTCLAVICLNSDENCYLQVFSKECKYIEKN